MSHKYMLAIHKKYLKDRAELDLESPPLFSEDPWRMEVYEMNIPFSEPFSDITTPPTGRFYRKLADPSGIPIVAILVPMQISYPDKDATCFLDCVVHTRIASYRAREFRIGIVEYAEVIRGQGGKPALRAALPPGETLREIMEAWLRVVKDSIMHDFGEELDGKVRG